VSLTTARAAYTDCYDFYSAAADTTGGIRIPVGTSKDAQTLQMRMNMARQIQRNESRRVYQSDHPLYDVSEFDDLKVQIREDTTGEWWMYISPHGRHDLLALAEPIEEPTDDHQPEEGLRE